MVQGPATGLTPIGFFVRVGENAEGLMPAAELQPAGENRALGFGDVVKVLMAGIDTAQRRVTLLLALPLCFLVGPVWLLKPGPRAIRRCRVCPLA